MITSKHLFIAQVLVCLGAASVGCGASRASGRPSGGRRGTYEAMTIPPTTASTSDETVNGESVGVFTLRYKTPHSESNNRLWISKATGLPVKTEAVLTGGMTISITFRYDNVRLPAGAN